MFDCTSGVILVNTKLSRCQAASCHCRGVEPVNIETEVIVTKKNIPTLPVYNSLCNDCYFVCVYTLFYNGWFDVIGRGYSWY